jgi:hypothetical protein
MLPEFQPHLKKNLRREILIYVLNHSVVSPQQILMNIRSHTHIMWMLYIEFYSNRTKNRKAREEIYEGLRVNTTSIEPILTKFSLNDNVLQETAIPNSS